MTTVVVAAACTACGGARVVPDPVAERCGYGPRPRPCPACCCEVCGQPTDTPPECEDCWLDEDQDFKRSQDR
jgi:hypothetical protein